MGARAPVRNDRLERLCDYPFTRLRALLSDVSPPSDRPQHDLSIGDPQHAPPALITEALARHPDGWGRYPPLAGTPHWRSAALGWLMRRYRLPAGFVGEDAILPLAGTREGLYLLGQLCVPTHKAGHAPLVLMPNPFYAVYEAAGTIPGAVPHYLAADRTTGFLPDLDAIPAGVLERTALMVLTSPANPQGVFADGRYIGRALSLARAHGFTLAVDECYADVWDREPPPGALETALGIGGERPLRNLLVFHSLSKRSSAAGLRSGFVAGDPDLIRDFARLRSYANAGTPLPIFAAAAALWADDAHAEATRGLYRAAIDAAAQALGDRFGFYRPPGGFFLWLDVGDGVAAARRLWTEAGVRVLPGSYLTRPDATGVDHGRRFIRVALVHPADRIGDACRAIARTLDDAEADHG